MHYLTVVLLAPDTERIVQAVNEVLRGSRGSTVRTFAVVEAPCDCVAAVPSSEDFLAVDSSSEGRYWDERLIEARRNGDEETEEELLVKRYWQAAVHASLGPDFGRVKPDCYFCNGGGSLESTRDPESHTDWWEIGGRWSGAVTAYEHERCREHPALVGNLALVGRLAGEFEPAVVVMPSGEWHQGELLMTPSFLSPSEFLESDRDQVESWSRFVGRCFRAHPDHLGVVVDCHG